MSISRVKHELGCCLETDLQRVVTTSGWTTFNDLFRCRLTEEARSCRGLRRKFHLKRLQSQRQSTTGWLTPNDDLTQWDANFLLVFFLLCFFKENKKNRMLFFLQGNDGGRQQVEEPPTLWYQMLGTRLSMRKQEQHSVMVKNLCVRICKMDTHTHTHTHR